MKEWLGKVRGRSLMAAFLVLGGGLVAALCFMLADDQLLGLELRTLDLRFRNRGPVPVDHSPLVIVEVDNRSYKDLDARWPFSRAWHAHVLQNLLDAGARAVVFDIMFTESAAEDPAGDRALAEVVARAKREGRTVILSGELIQERLPDGKIYTRLDAPLPILRETGSPWGLVDDIIDRDRINRRYHLFQPYQGELLPTIGTRLIMELEGVQTLSLPVADTLSIGTRRIPLVRGLSNIMRIHYRGPTGTFPRYSFSSILDDADFDLASPEMDTDYMEIMKNPELYTALFGEEDPPPFLDKIVLVGVSADDLHDNKGIPWQGEDGTTMEMPGVETHAHAIQTMLDGRYIRETPWLLEIGLIAALALAGMAIVLTLGPVPAALGTLALIALWFWFCQWSFDRSALWLPLLSPGIAAAGAWVSGVLHQFLRARRERQEVRNIFSRYVSRAVVNEVLRN
ncbi:MAG: CHASE2 domain-containing protein, partial [Candidatus Cloacimonetes bacterium]|nr:CHASE2 domain-containing protein [Candidatus Cloacimonadota bacterium]